MFGIGMPELIVILIIVMVIFGAGKLPEIGRGIGQGIRDFKKATRDEQPEQIAYREEDKKAESNT